jgi:hypothetical protein
MTEGSIYVVIALLAILLIVGAISVAQARTFRTPANATCETVRYWYSALGGEAGVREYGRANNIRLTVAQERKARACLRVR